jgi:hypothetical protein
LRQVEISRGEPNPEPEKGVPTAATNILFLHHHHTATVAGGVPRPHGSGTPTAARMPPSGLATVNVDTIDVNPDNDSDDTSSPILPAPAPAPALSPSGIAGALLVLFVVARRRLRFGRKS